MPHYFFDTRDGDRFISDDYGTVLPDLQAAKKVAAESLAELAREVVPGSDKRVLTVEVRDQQQLVLETRLTF